MTDNNGWNSNMDEAPDDTLVLCWAPNFYWIGMRTMGVWLEDQTGDQISTAKASWFPLPAPPEQEA